MKATGLLTLIACILLTGGCEEFKESKEFNSIIHKNDLSIVMKVNTDATHEAVIEKIPESGQTNEGCLKIGVADELTVRGEAAIEPGKKYRLSVTLKNESADPLVLYSFWKSAITAARHFTFKGENGNPPSSATQEVHRDWVTYEETFEAEEKEISFMLTLSSGKGTFYLKEIIIEKLED